MPFADESLARIPRLQNFILSLSNLLEETQDESTIISSGKVFMEQLVKSDDWLPEAFARPNPDKYQQFLLYLDPQERFSIVSFVWGPGQFTPVHDHTVWGLVGLLRGSEISQAYDYHDQGNLIPSGPPVRMMPGEVELVSPTIGDIHQVSNGLNDQLSISIHVYGADIGKVRRHIFRADGTVKEFISGYSNPSVKDFI